MTPLRQLWDWFWALPWSRKGPAIAIAALVPAVAVGVALALALGGSDATDTTSPTATPGVTNTPMRSSASGVTPTLVSTTTPAPTRTQPPANGGAGAPLELGYQLVGTMDSVSMDNMLGFIMIPGSTDEAVVLTQDGAIWRVSTSDSFPPQPFGDVSDRLVPDRENEEGLLGLAFSPNYGSDGRVYVHYTGGPERHTVVSRFLVTNNRMDMESERVLLTVPQPYPNHNGGQLAFGPDGMLYLGLGDGGAGGDPQGNGQDLGTLLGKILRLDVSGDGYRVPPDNPFVGRAGARGEIYAYGLRNPWSFAFDRGTGGLWVGDVGQNAWEEVDRIVAGGNYGWNIYEGFECFAGPCDASGLRAPRAVYGHDQGCSVTGGRVYRGAALPELRGWYVYGDFCSGRVWAVETQGSGAPVLLAESGLPISNWGELPNGELIAVTFANQLFRLERAE